MNWLNHLMRKPAAKAPKRAPAQAQPALAAPQAGDPAQAWIAAVCGAADKAAAIGWLAHLDGEAALGEVAMHARFAEVRLAAAERIQGGAILEQVAHHSRDKDKQVYRHCSELLRHRRQAAERAQRAQRLIADLSALLASAPLSVSRVLDLQDELRALGDGFAEQGACQALLEQANARLKHEADARRGLPARQAAAEALAAACSPGAWPDRAQLAQWREECASLRRAHAETPAWLAGQPSAHAVDALLPHIDARLAALATEHARIQDCEQFLDAHADTPIDEDAARGWDALAKPEHLGTRQALQARWQALRAPPPAPAPPPAAAPQAPEPVAAPAPVRVDGQAVRGLIEALEQAAEQGHLAQADAVARQIKAAVGSASLERGLDARLQRAHARLGELRGWAHWGATQKREQLVAAAQALLAADHSVEHLAAAVPALREQWMQLNAQAPSTKTQWESFDAALSKAYQPVAAVRAQEAARRAQARADKDALCAQWEAEVAAIDWASAELTAIEARRQQMLGQWRGAAKAGGRDERLLHKRLDALIGGIDQRIGAARAAEVQRREQLIAAAEALRELADLRQATADAKSLQERWRSEAGSLRLARADEQRLWHRFRGACDAVFGRRDAERAELLAQRGQRAQARAAMLDAFAASLDRADAPAVKRALAQFRASWANDREAGASADPLERRAIALQQQAQQRIDALQRQGRRMRLEQLGQQAASTEGLDAEALAAGRATRETLLIDLEIALGLPTPEAYAPARRRRQLERLQSHFAAPAQSNAAPEELLQRWYAAAAPPDAALDERVSAVLRALIERGKATARPGARGPAQ